jgi:hypothetical protein
MDYVYICKDGDNEELRYSIRSVLKNAPEGNVWVVGGKPEWYSGNYVAVDQTKKKIDNARANLAAIITTREISNEFVLMNDDFFIVNPISEIKIFNGGSLLQKIYEYYDLVPRSSYLQKLSETHTELKMLGIRNPLDFELHVPMVMQKDNLKRTLRNKIALWRSYYGNLYSELGTEMSDVKVYKDGSLVSRSFDYKNIASDYISTDDDAFEKVLEDILLNMFPEPSPYELDYRQ